MIKKSLFKKPKNILEGKPAEAGTLSIPDNICCKCPTCKKLLFTGELMENLNVCHSCGHHFSLNARSRINITADPDTFSEQFSGIKPKNILDFPDYDEKLKKANLVSSEEESVLCGTCKVGGYDACIFAMEASFMMGSLGTVAGEKLSRLFEYATERKLPVIGFTLSGGARMQEGIYSLMQMAKVSGAVKYHSLGGNLYITALCDPTTGGVTASFAMQGDIIISEPKALICFAGPRVIEQTIRQKLPQGFQRAEFLVEKGFVDSIVERKDIKEYLSKILYLHQRSEV